MDRLDCLETFVHVVESGSFSAASRRIGISQPTVSKRIAHLEEIFGATLFLRTTRSLSPTEEARRVYDRARDIIETYNLAHVAARNARPEPTGTLILSVPTSLGRHQLMPLATEFMRLHPDVSLDVRLSESQVNLVEEGVELALRIGELASSSLRARALGRVRRFAVASPKYLHERPKPHEPGELVNHTCIGYSRFGTPSNWVFEGEHGRHVVNVECRIRLDDADTLQAAVCEGLGIAILPNWLVQPGLASGELEIILPDYTVPSLPLNAVYPVPGSLSLRARRFLDFLTERKSALG
ncbi:MAG: LysR family transcriptional regulator [Rhizobiaceae bacterium]